MLGSCPDLKREVSVIRSRAKLLDETRQGYERQLNQKESEIGRKQNEINARVEDLRQAELYQDSLATDLNEATSRNRELQSALALPENSAQNLLVRARDDLETLNLRLAELETELQTEQSNSRSKSIEISNLERDVQNRESELSRLNNQVQAKDRRINDLEQEILSLSSE